VKFPRLPNSKLELKRLYHRGFVRNRGVDARVGGEPRRVATGYEANEANHATEQL
jgi:hypothetical protein